MKILSLLLILVASAAHASTFVGNGGNAGDIEWDVTLKQIQMATSGIEKDPPADDLLCSCDDTYSNASICDALNSLSQEQRHFCGQTLKEQLPQLKPLIRDNKTVHVSWTTDRIDVLEDGHRRAVDAVTDRTLGQVTLNTDQFRGLNPTERVFLISHELMHLTTFNGKPLTDEGALGPFSSNDGSRRLVNAMAAALTIEAEEAGAFDRYRSTLNRPQGWKMTWLDLSFASPSGSPQSVYGVRDFHESSFRVTHYFSALGVNAEYSHLQGTKTTLSSITSDETINTLRAGLSYRVFPFKDPLTRFGQSNFALSADVDFARGSFNLKSAFNDESATSNKVGVSAAARYYFPIVIGFWLSIAETYESVPDPFTITTVNIDTNNGNNLFATSIGASYAF
jgi:hypothetical protein